EYGNRLLRRYKKDWSEDKRTEVVERLVHGYPSHEYIIDYVELQEMGFDVSLFCAGEEQACGNLFNILLEDKDYIAIVSPPAGESKKEEEHAKGSTVPMGKTSYRGKAKKHRSKH
ncbi:MAG: hypothetical protein WBC98_02630, partial [Candidatus Zixiibacteriota bacterium]